MGDLRGSLALRRINAINENNVQQADRVRDHPESGVEAPPTPISMPAGVRTKKGGHMGPPFGGVVRASATR